MTMIRLLAAGNRKPGICRRFDCGYPADSTTNAFNHMQVIGLKKTVVSQKRPSGHFA
jgi:hypothetical protein